MGVDRPDRTYCFPPPGTRVSHFEPEKLYTCLEEEKSNLNHEKNPPTFHEILVV